MAHLGGLASAHCYAIAPMLFASLAMSYTHCKACMMSAPNFFAVCQLEVPGTGEDFRLTMAWVTFFGGNPDPQNQRTWKSWFFGNTGATLCFPSTLGTAVPFPQPNTGFLELLGVSDQFSEPMKTLKWMCFLPGTVHQNRCLKKNKSYKLYQTHRIHGNGISTYI